MTVLIVKSNLNDECFNEARNVFKRKYVEREFGLWISYSKPILESGSVVKLYDYKEAQDFLNNFGDLIHILTVPYKDIYNETKSRVLTKLINDKSFGSLKTLTLYGCKGSVLDEFKNVFTLVESLDIYTEFLNVLPGSRLNRIFPNLKKFDISFSKASDWTFINGNFSKLIEFRTLLPEFPEYDVIEVSHIASFLRNNRQIKKLRIAYSNHKLLREVNNILPQLERLYLNELPNRFSSFFSRPVYFRNLKYFEIASFLGKMPHKIVFNRLERLSIIIQDKYFNQWQQFINNQVNSNISRLDLYIDAVRDEFPNIPIVFPQLRSAYITTIWTNLFADDVILFLVNSKELRYLELTAPISDSEVKRLEENIPSNWSVKFHATGWDGVKMIFQWG